MRHFQLTALVPLWSRLEPPLCARSSLCSVSTQCWRSSPCMDDSLQLHCWRAVRMTWICSFLPRIIFLREHYTPSSPSVAVFWSLPGWRAIPFTEWLIFPEGDAAVGTCAIQELGPGSERGRLFHKFTVSGVWSENVSPHSWGTPGSCGPASGPAPPKGVSRTDSLL
ncbi:hypothetical protein DNTS_014474 [Danionella cerebrum]|uniref:Uncharacterized protein n=1 Tax=Danionella cerebrum TaxID=2873325 RepID=A0A553MKS1_9TELE|nr:hypothetical protein DNTS_014474 [Danionella translucida]